MRPSQKCGGRFCRYLGCVASHNGTQEFAVFAKVVTVSDDGTQEAAFFWDIVTVSHNTTLCYAETGNFRGSYRPCQ